MFVGLVVVVVVVVVVVCMLCGFDLYVVVHVTTIDAVNVIQIAQSDTKITSEFNSLMSSTNTLSCRPKQQVSFCIVYKMTPAVFFPESSGTLG